MLGIEAKLYWRSAGTHAAPTWSEVDGISDFAPNENWDVAEILIRRGRVKYGAKTALDIGFTGKLLREPADANFAGILAALRSPDDAIDLMILDGDKDTVGTLGVRASYQITTGGGSQGSAEVLHLDITGVPYPVPTAEKPTYVLVAAGPTVTFPAI